MGVRSTWSRFKLLNCRSVGDSPSVRGRTWIHGAGAIRIGHHVRIEATDAPVELHARAGAEIAIGDDVVIEGGTSIEASRSVVIADGARIGAFTKILDNHFHPLRGDRFRLTPGEPVEICHGATIGPRSVLLPGSRVPPGAVVPAESVLRRLRRGPKPSSAAATPPPPAGAPQRWRGIESPRDALRFAVEVLDKIRFKATCRYSHAKLRAAASGIGSGVLVGGSLHVRNEGTLVLGNDVWIRGRPIASHVTVHRGGVLRVLDGTSFNYGVRIEARRSIGIGRRCMFGSHVLIADALDGREAPVVIEDDVWIGHGSRIEPGVKVGARSVVSAGSIVAQDVPPDSLAMGRPLRCFSLSLLADPEDT